MGMLTRHGVSCIRASASRDRRKAQSMPLSRRSVRTAVTLPLVHTTHLAWAQPHRLPLVGYVSGDQSNDDIVAFRDAHRGKHDYRAGVAIAHADLDMISVHSCPILSQ